MASSNQHVTPTLLSPDQAEFIAENFSALGDPSRARIVFALTQGEQSVNALAGIARISASAVSHHLARLRSLHLVMARRAANQVFYRVDDEHVARLYHEMLSHLDHLKRNLPDHHFDPDPEHNLEAQETPIIP
jgi:DNA-binding transcriptional ArsR family regulator